MSKTKRTPEPKRTVEGEFQQWLTKVYGRKDLSKVQREEMRKAFTCGAFVFMNIMQEISEKETEDVACTKLEILCQEMTKQIGEWC